MSIEENKEAVRRYIEAFNDGNVSSFDEILASPVLLHMANGTDKERTVEESKQFIATMRSRMPDIRVDIEDVIAEGDKAVARFAVTATKDGDPISVEHGYIYRLEDGKIAEQWLIANQPVPA